MPVEASAPVRVPEAPTAPMTRVPEALTALTVFTVRVWEVLTAPTVLLVCAGPQGGAVRRTP
ncbi:hypothetical protein [Streptomyces sp. NPDC005141]